MNIVFFIASFEGHTHIYFFYYSISYLLASLSRVIATRTLFLKKININKMVASVTPRDTTDKHRQQQQVENQPGCSRFMISWLTHTNENNMNMLLVIPLFKTNHHNLMGAAATMILLNSVMF